MPSKDGKLYTSVAKRARPRTHLSKIVTSPPSLYLPHLYKLDDILAALIVRRESPWDIYLLAITYNIVGLVVIAARRTRLLRVVAETVYLAALPSIAMRLMQKYDKEEGVAGVTILCRWPIDLDVVRFLSATAMVVSIAPLKENVASRD
ncbi:uncharacterized protein N7503_006494 [Penicillium pulvis]|uniref:uncharacterized protein n=1 Tax=Penicillium pulvis TaxID=1562058 RepID=UPI0025468AFB|nr:uncharacterized protein N7503_006494 [Penicillium pulvis]KAJ5798989.1 hypothetical protein N7503_006494 [Penicillium pulvis]